MSDSLWPHWLQYTRPPCPSPTPGAYSNSCLSSPWSHPTISSSVVPFSSCLQSFPASGSFQMSQFFASGSQSIGVSASASVLPMNIQDWFPLGWTGWISLLLELLADIFQRTLLKEQSLRYRRFQWKNYSPEAGMPFSLCVETSTLNTSSLSQGYFIRGWRAWQEGRHLGSELVCLLGHILRGRPLVSSKLQLSPKHFPLQPAICMGKFNILYDVDLWWQLRTYYQSLFHH